MNDATDGSPTVPGLLSESARIRDAIEAIDRSEYKIALVVDGERHLRGTVTDGDVRRALLAGQPLDGPIQEIMHRSPVVCQVGRPYGPAEAEARKRLISQIPVLDADGMVVGIHMAHRGSADETAENAVVLMAGGLGTRLRPMTENAPKPLLDVGEKPMLETIVDQLVAQGFRRFYFSVRYKAEMVKRHFGDGDRWNSKFSYLHEDTPLGTAGALGLLPERPSVPFIVMNADVLTKVDLRLMLDFHEQSGSVATMGVRAFDFQIPYGVVSTEETFITYIEEKPVQQIFVNAGIYSLEPKVLDLVETGCRLDMPDLFNRMIAEGHRAAAFPVREYWIDVGRLEDYRRANDDYAGEFS